MTFGKTKQLVRKSAEEIAFRQFYPNTYIEVLWKAPDGKTFCASAVCTCGYRDKWSPQTGREIAFGMATATIARKYQAYVKRNLT